nr:hypothetical protein [uncultured Methanoregula sp.]
MKKEISLIILLCGFCLLLILTTGCTNQSSTSQSAPTIGSKSLQSMSLSELRGYESQGLLPSNVNPFVIVDGSCWKITNKKLIQCTDREVTTLLGTGWK